MAEGGSSNCHIVPTRDTHIFRFRARLASPEDGHLSRPFAQSSTVVAGRKCSVSYYPARASTSVSFNLSVKNHPVLEASAKVSTHMVLLDKAGSPAPSIGTGKTLNFSFGGRFVEGGLYNLKAERDDIKANCVVDNYFVVLCSVDIDWTPPTSSLEEDELPDLGHDLALMLDKQEHTDVSFNVGGESFGAHRLVLAARSPVFNAELYGPMAESKMTSITIQDMQAATFRSMLHYLYHGSLPNNASTTVAEYQHLLIAADRYGVERLKKICEAKPSVDGVTIDSVVSMLELAEDHVCPKLKASCFDFLADDENFRIVATSCEYLHLMQSFPSLLVEARNRSKIPHEKPTIMEPGSNKKPRLC